MSTHNKECAISITDISINDISSCRYDLAIFASGYESRCTQGASHIPLKCFNEILILGFKNVHIKKLRDNNDALFFKLLGRHPIIEDANFLERIASAISCAIKIAMIEGRSPKILIDYSSMHREWYGYILSYIRYVLPEHHKASIDFLYSHGKYSDCYENVLENAVLESIAPLVGMEGLSASRSSSIAVLGLGFSITAGLSALERLQPDKIFSVLASPEADARYYKISRTRNKPLINRSNSVIELPISSLLSTYRGLAELIFPFASRYHINVLPMGPKPHVLASMLLSLSFRSVGCLYGKMRYSQHIDILGTGVFSAARIELTGDQYLHIDTNCNT